MIFRNKYFKRIAFVLIVCIFISCLIVQTDAGVGFSEIRFILLLCDRDNNAKYTVISRTEFEDYAVYGSFRIIPSDGTFDKRGETFQVCIVCFATHAEYDESGNYIPEALSPSRTISSYTADNYIDTVYFESAKAEFEKITEFGFARKTLWQIEADGDYNTVISP